MMNVFPSSSTLAVALNNTAVDLLRRGQNEDAMQLFDCAWCSLNLRVPSGIVDSIPQPQDQAPPFHETPHLIPPSPCDSPCGTRCPTPSPVVQEDQHLGTSTLGLATLSAFLHLTMSRRDVIVHSVNTDNSTSSKVSMADEEDLKASPSNFFSIYNRAFVLNDHGRDIDLPLWLRCVPHIPAVLLYNAGLTYHRRAVSDGSTSMFVKALELYQMSKIFLENNANSGFYLIELDILLLALANNMGHCHSHFCNMTETRMCLEHMLTIFFRSESTVLLTKDEYVFFYINILLGVGRKPIFAAAA
jgi:hypothetical protein